MLLYTLYMATIQKRVSRGRTYWSIVESRRVGGKPRPVIIEYLGTAESLLKRLQEGIPKKVRSYSHGAIAVILDIAEDLQIVQTINRHLPHKQIRDGFTVGGSLLLASLGRICQPTSKRGWYQGFAQHTSLSYLLRMSLGKLDSQHFWDQMGALPTSRISQIEEEIVTTLLEKEEITLDTLLLDMTNFFTFISSFNQNSNLAKRGWNKQKRMDLRQFGLLLLISGEEQIPLFHKIYEGNLTDRTIFKEQFQEILNRFKAISCTLEEITLTFDQGNNSKKMLKEVEAGIYFVGALSPYQHKGLVGEANKAFEKVKVGDNLIDCYRTRKDIWQIDLTVVVYISYKLQRGQTKGLNQDLNKCFMQLTDLKEKIKVPTKRGKKRKGEKLEKKIVSLIGETNIPKGLVSFKLSPLKDDAFKLNFWLNQEELDFLKEEWFGRRILITNRHNWTTEEIIKAYFGQSRIEGVFKRIKNPFHLAFRPQYHWTDQKVEVHGFICVLALILLMVAYKRAREKANFKGTPETLIEKLSCIRLATFIENPPQKSRGPYRAVYRLEEMEEDLLELAKGLGLIEHSLKSNIPFSVYK